MYLGHLEYSMCNGYQEMGLHLYIEMSNGGKMIPMPIVGHLMNKVGVGYCAKRLNLEYSYRISQVCKF